MSKKKSITLLSIISVLVAFALVMTFIRFPIGVKNYNSAIGSIELDYDLQGGIAYTLTWSGDNEEEVEDIDSVIDTLEYRLNELGYSLYSVKAIKSTNANVKDYDIRIETRNTSSIADDIEVVAAPGEVQFYGGTSENPTTEILSDIDVIDDAQYLGSVLDDQNNTFYQVSITFTQEGYDALMEEISGAGVGSNYYFLMKLGENNLPLNKETISEDDFSKRTLNVYLPSEALARQYALQIRTGGLAYIYEVSPDPAIISSPYGENVATKSAIAIGALVALIMVALVVYYRGLGVIGALSMLIFILGETWLLLAVPGIVLSMGGVIGIMVSTIVTALGIVYVLEKIKTAYANSEKTVLASIKKGYKDTFMATIGAGVVSGIIALALLSFASGLIKGFAITFGIGVVVGVITILLFTRMYTALILPLVENKEKFLNLNRAEV